MKYLIQIYSNPESRAMWESFTPEQQAEGYAYYQAISDELVSSGEYVAAEALADISLAKRVRQADGTAGMAMLVLLRRMKRDELTVHGFRSTFRDWAAERTGFPAEVAEMALAHTVADAVERAYRRGDLFQKRRQLADAWGRYCTDAPVADVVPIAAAAR